MTAGALMIPRGAGLDDDTPGVLRLPQSDCFVSGGSVLYCGM